jgi:hypothetical protein
MDRRQFLIAGAGLAAGASGHSAGRGRSGTRDQESTESKGGTKSDRGAPFPEIVHKADFCVVGGGMAGLCAALAAARHGAKVVLIQDRPVLGGNASSEIRVHICGADRHNKIPHMRETGILEEVRLENLRHNPQANFSIWDTILYEKMRYTPNIELLLNCSCLGAEMDGSRIRSISGWQLTTQTWHKVAATIYADCSGDAVLAPLTGAPFRMGREARAEYGESIAPEQADNKTMGMTCLFMARECDTPQPFEAPAWAYRYDREEDLPGGANRHAKWWRMGYWWVELGGEHDSIHDTEMLRDELLKTVYGMWDHIKNRGAHGADNWTLEWIQFLPGKRESRRYIGDHVLTQLDLEARGQFEDVVAYGGWTMDDHHPAGFAAAKIKAPATIFHPCPSPYGIPYRALYSKKIRNLMFAGRCASATHSAMSSTRVMGTCSSMGQAVGTAAALATKRKLLPKELGAHVRELQQALIEDDCYLPGVKQELSPLTREAKLAASQGDPEPLRDGVKRQVEKDPHCWVAHRGDSVTYSLARAAQVKEAVLVLDSAMDKCVAMSYHQKDNQLRAVPDVMAKTFRIEGLVQGAWAPLQRVEGNYQRQVRIPIGKELEGVRFTLEETWGAESSRVYAFYLT